MGRRRDVVIQLLSPYTQIDSESVPGSVDTSGRLIRSDPESLLACAHFIEATPFHQCRHRLSRRCLSTLDDFIDVDGDELHLPAEQLTRALASHLDRHKEGLMVEPLWLTFFVRVT